MMQLIGMLDSPYVRRVAISLQCLELPYTHRSLSVFRNLDEFRDLSPVVKAPTLICDDGGVLLDSNLIIAHAESLAAPRRLFPSDPAERLLVLRTTGLALAACEKSVQLVYECRLRPADKQHAPWIDRVTEQLAAAYRALDAEIGRRPPAPSEEGLDQGSISAAVVWYFTQQELPGAVDPARHPALSAWSAVAEQMSVFRRAPHGARTYPVED